MAFYVRTFLVKNFYQLLSAKGERRMSEDSTLKHLTFYTCPTLHTGVYKDVCRVLKKEESFSVIFAIKDHKLTLEHYSRVLSQQYDLPVYWCLTSP